MLEEILNKLHHISDLNVLSRTSVEQYKNSTKDIKEIAKELEVGNILEGSIRMYGDRFRINVQLIQSKTGFDLWSAEFDGVLSDTIFIVQSNIAEEIAMKLQATITPLERQQIEKAPTTNYLAYEKYIQGYLFLSEYWRIFNNEDIEMAEKLFRESLEIDPEFAMGYSGLADIYLNQGKLDSFNYFADKIIEIDPNNYWGYIWKGWFYRNEHEIDKALEFFEKALELAPNEGNTYYELGRLYCDKMQDYITGIPYLKKAIEIGYKKKIVEGLATHYCNMGRVYLNIGDYEKAKHYYKTALEINPKCFIIYEYCWLLGIETAPELAFETADSLICNIPTCEHHCNSIKSFALYLSGEISRAEAHFIKYEAQFEIGIPNTADSVWIVPIYKALGKEQQALSILNSCRSSLQNKLKEREHWWTNLSLSLIHAMLDDKEKAVEYLSNAVDLGLKFGWHDFIEIYPPFENLWDDPEFKAIVKRAQDEKAAIRVQVREMEERGELDILSL